MTVQTIDKSTPQLTVYEITAVQGDVWYLHLTSDTTWDQVMSIAVFVEGLTKFDKSEGKKGPYYVPNAIRKEGDVSLDFPAPLMPAGKFSYTVMTPTLRYYCLVDPKNRPLDGKVVRLKNGETYSPQIGRRLFTAMGQIDANGSLFSEPSTVDIQTSGAVVKSMTDKTLLIDMAAL